MMSDDMALVREFAASHSEPAFATLVQRHLGLVHSAALRQVGDAHLAEEIAQAVFLILARKAPSLGPKTILSAWLYRTTRYAAADALKANRRRQAREQEAYMQSTLTQPDADTWAQLAPLLDDAMAELGETDRAALVLRFFENKTVGEIAGALRMEEAAAQKRVGRALEKLRVYFSKRGMALPAAALTAAISANAVQAAPVGLALTISTAAALTGTTLATATTATAIKTIAMTTLQKAVITATLAIVAGVGIYEARQASQLREHVQTLQQQQGPLIEQINQWQSQREEAANRLSAFAAEIERLKGNSGELLRLRGEVARLRRESRESEELKVSSENNSMETAANDLLLKVNLLKQRLEKIPDKKIPEIQFVTPIDWLNLALQYDPKADSDARNIAFATRTMAKNRFAPMIAQALRNYTNANEGRLPESLAQLKTYFATPVENLLLERYELLGVGKLEQTPWGEMLIKEKAIADTMQDFLYSIGMDGYEFKHATGTNLTPGLGGHFPGARVPKATFE